MYQKYMMVSFLLHKYVLCMKKVSQLFSVKKWHASNHSSTVDMACIGQNLSFCYSFLSYWEIQSFSKAFYHPLLFEGL